MVIDNHAISFAFVKRMRACFATLLSLSLTIYLTGCALLPEGRGMAQSAHAFRAAIGALSCHNRFFRLARMLLQRKAEGA